MVKSPNLKKNVKKSTTKWPLMSFLVPPKTQCFAFWSWTQTNTSSKLVLWAVLMGAQPKAETLKGVFLLQTSWWMPMGFCWFFFGVAGKKHISMVISHNSSVFAWWCLVVHSMGFSGCILGFVGRSDCLVFQRLLWDFSPASVLFSGDCSIGVLVWCVLTSMFSCLKLVVHCLARVFSSPVKVVLRLSGYVWAWKSNIYNIGPKKLRKYHNKKFKVPSCNSYPPPSWVFTCRVSPLTCPPGIGCFQKYLLLFQIFSLSFRWAAFLPASPKDPSTFPAKTDPKWASQGRKSLGMWFLVWSHKSYYASKKVNLVFPFTDHFECRISSYSKPHRTSGAAGSFCLCQSI